MDDAQRLQSNLTRLREASSTQVKSLEEQLAEKTELVASLELSLANRSDYEEMKRELNVIKMVEFSTAASSSSVTGAHDMTSTNEGVSGCNYTLLGHITLFVGGVCGLNTTASPSCRPLHLNHLKCSFWRRTEVSSPLCWSKRPHLSISRPRPIYVCMKWLLITLFVPCTGHTVAGMVD